MDGFTLKCNACGAEVDFATNHKEYCREGVMGNETDIYFDIDYECAISNIKCNKCSNKIEL
jgi:hypothetical protein